MPRRQRLYARVRSAVPFSARAARVRCTLPTRNERCSRHAVVPTTPWRRSSSVRVHDAGPTETVARFGRGRSLLGRLVRKLRPRRFVRTRSSSPREWRRLPIGAELAPSGGVHFRVWAPRVAQVEVEVDGQRIRLETEPGGYHSGPAPAIRAGARYAYRLDGGPPLSGSRVSIPARRPPRAVRGDRSGGLRVDGHPVARRPARGPGALRDARRHVHDRPGRGAAAAQRAAGAGAGWASPSWR